LGPQLVWVLNWCGLVSERAFGGFQNSRQAVELLGVEGMDWEGGSALTLEAVVIWRQL